MTHIRSALLPVGLLVVCCAVWQVVVTAGQVPEYVLPAPLTVLGTMVADAPLLATESVPTLLAVLAGFGLAVLVALPVAVLMTYSDALHRALYPLLIVAQVVPKVAVAPLFIIWFGFGQLPKVLMVALISFFPLIVDALVGLAATRPQSLVLVRSMGAGRWQAFWKVRWPWALPSIFAGAKVAVTLAVVGAVVAEFVGSDDGLGVVLLDARGNLDSAMAFAAIGWLTIAGLLLFGAVALAERVLVPGGRRAASAEAAGSL
ncbi:ABC transporter permease [Saccharopolyspora sp. HNM0983]|uniref:ABC transporter permease n=1 Tax=Saccharopolyspora montiporae TaxID=2781240 RepID=A0A929B784_9PSEU|nr:ABC transporter permease [Saccharopolyspora sp. HNM0983]MBE9373516.1 ABC transporter permease [Saccharopolyspora sp. HNM0983]